MVLTVSEVAPLAEGSKRIALETGLSANKKSKTNKGPKQPSEPLQANKVWKPRLGEPPMWANTRQQAVDTLEWFNSMQGGAAHKGKVCTGYLVDKDNGARSFMNDEVIITRMGGDSEKDGDKVSLKKDQAQTGTIIDSIMASLTAKKAVGVVIGSNNELLKIKIPHRYCVMDWYIITDVWMEKMGRYAGWRVRLEKLDLSTKGWWTEIESDVQGSKMQVSAALPRPKPSTPISNASSSISNRAPPKLSCSACGKDSTQVYIQPGWTCLHRPCPNFWKIRGIPLIDSMDFVYHPDFLNYRQPNRSDIPDPGPLAKIVDRNIEPSEGSVDKQEWKGIVCPMCRKCIQRVTWDAWDCSNDPGRQPHETCCYRVVRKMREVPLQSVLTAGKPYPKLPCLIESPAVDKVSLMPFEIRTYLIPNGGSITHFVSNAAINGRANGPDFLFTQLQRLDLGLKRYPLGAAQGKHDEKQKKDKTEQKQMKKQAAAGTVRFRLTLLIVQGTLTCHFAVNYGVPYKYVVSVDSKAFSDAPSEILTALGRLSWATEQAVTRVGGQYQPPNELLALGYLEEMKIGFHDDGEKDLGPTIATISLGTRSRMDIRMKSKYYFGVGRSSGDRSPTPTSDDPVLPGCWKEDDRRFLKSQFEAGQITQDDYKSQRRALLGGKKPKSEPSRMLSLELRHGDLIVMHGADLQKYFEHAVVPDHGLRFALTARYIHTEDEGDLLKGSFELNKDQIYDGQ